MRNRNIANHGGRHLNRDQSSKLLRIHAPMIHRPQDDIRVGKPLTKANEDVADQQLAQSGGKRPNDREEGMGRDGGTGLRYTGSFGWFLSHEKLEQKS